MFGYYHSAATRARALSYAYAREAELADARNVVEQLKINIDQGCNVGATLETATDSRSAHYYPDEYYL